ncbi:sensor histidine kinase [Fundidesulfovibrio terrae]|uniref:sensor histidine kinase n=1 Tax=Fundidesulfovibrio terrae TaxID=2922866 RepID=UPI001FAEBE36|nr:7TM diverse intracellular signaling domain-containing protein [Fundidesulfovibrio terrae]
MILPRHTHSIAALATLILLSCAGCSLQKETAPVAERGVLDLSGWEPTRDGPVALDGQWEFYWDRLLAPVDFREGAERPAMSGYLRLPGFWKDHELDGRRLSGEGQATFRLRLLLGPGAHRLGVRLFSLPAAYRLWANGRLVASAGVVGRTKEAETAERSLVMADLPNEGGPVDLVLQVSNHYFRRGGVHYPVLLADMDQLEQAHVRTWCWSMFFTGVLLLAFAYHMMLYFLRKKDVSTLYFGLDCLVLSILYITMDSSEWLIRLVVPGVSIEAATTICFICYAIYHSIIYRFFMSLYKNEFCIQIQQFCDIRSGAALFAVLFLSKSAVYDMLPAFAVSSLFINACYIVSLGLCVRRGKDGALFLLGGCVILAAASLSELYHHIFSTSPGTIFPMGLTAFVLSQAFVLAKRFTSAFTAVENLSQAMESSNAALRAEMEERSRLEREIVCVSEEERRRLSHNLHDGLCQQLTGARLRCAVLGREFSEKSGLTPGFQQLSTLLDKAVDHAYDLSRGLWPVEHEQTGGKPSLEAMVQRFRESSEFHIELRQGIACDSCSNSHLTQIFRIAQEAIANAVKHSGGCRICVALRCAAGGAISLTVSDDGQGRKTDRPTPGGLGLRIMAHRARVAGGELVVSDAPEGGTVVVCTAPCDNGNKRPDTG